ncbi:MAG: peptidase S16 [Solirubrobacterales bacterium]|nr:MAG: peptidase S16 [Solirubrobacterales bacterium]
MPEGRSPGFPLFPLGIVALPGEVIPLHIFEERYKTMVDECLREEREFGIVWLADDGLREIGCAVAIEEILERTQDGRINLLARGTRPIRVLERQKDLPYPAGVIEFVEDRSETLDPELERTAHEAYADLVKRATDDDPDQQELSEMGSYAMAATIELGLDVKQGLLDLRSENGRLALVTRLFRAAIKRLELLERAQERARSNGKMRLG